MIIFEYSQDCSDEDLKKQIQRRYDFIKAKPEGTCIPIVVKREYVGRLCKLSDKEANKLINDGKAVEVHEGGRLHPSRFGRY